MAPRRQSRVGNTRRDAALDAMRAFGFDDSLIKKTLNELLKVYGKDGWVFIETDCYKVLTEAILDTIDQKQPEQDDVNLIKNHPEQEDDNLIGIQPDRDHVTEVLPDLLITDRPHIDEPQDEDITTPQVDESEVASGDYVQEMLEQVLPDEEEPYAVRNCSEHQEINPICETLTADNNANRGADKRRRKPCFGWIGDEEDDYVILNSSNQ